LAHWSAQSRYNKCQAKVGTLRFGGCFFSFVSPQKKSWQLAVGDLLFSVISQSTTVSYC
jgi:hypothetical protein